MKSFFGWLKNSTKIKRWIFLMLIGMILSVSILANVFDSGIYKVSSLFLGFVITSIPIMFIEEKESFKNTSCIW